MVKNKQQQQEVIAYITSTCNDLKKKTYHLLYVS